MNIFCSKNFCHLFFCYFPAKVNIRCGGPPCVCICSQFVYIGVATCHISSPNIRNSVVMHNCIMLRFDLLNNPALLADLTTTTKFEILYCLVSSRNISKNTGLSSNHYANLRKSLMIFEYTIYIYRYIFYIWDTRLINPSAISLEFRTC